MKVLLLTLVLMLFLGAGVIAYWRWVTVSVDQQPSPQPTASFVPQPTAAASPVASPANDLIVLQSPQPEERISSPVVITGQARGPWFFEGSFPVVLTNWDGLIIAEGVATAEGEWMTEEFVPFRAELTFTKPDYGERGSLILQKANPSGLPENADALEITIFFQ
jgi:hypothetical protein